MLKRCIKCNEEKNTTEFRKDSNLKDGLRSECKTCSRSYQKDRYQYIYAGRYVERNRAHRNELSRRIRIIRELNPCTACGESDISCIDFHHVNEDEKEGLVTSFQSWSKIVNELTKCISLCANCHRKYHAGKIQLSYPLQFVKWDVFEPFPKFSYKNHPSKE